MKNRKGFKPVLWTILGYGALGSALIFGIQVKQIQGKIERATSCDVLSIDKIKPNFIYIEDPNLQEEIQAGISLNRERLKLTRLHKWLYDHIEGSFIFRNLYSYKKNLPWRFLRLAQDEKQSVRARAVKALASLKNLTDADYRQLAQACDMRTAIALARTSDNIKFFLDPPYFKIRVDRKSVIKKLRDFLLVIESQTTHPCLQDFINKVVIDMIDVEGKVFDDDFRFSYENNDFVPMCLEALLHHSMKEINARQIIDSGGLPILMEVYKFLHEHKQKSHETLIVLSRLMSNISACSGAGEKFFTSGWVKILWILSHHKDLRISVPAQKALVNLDRDDPGLEEATFFRRIFPLHPTKRTSVRPKLDVIFVHGLLGEIFTTWRQRDSGHCSHKSPLELLGLIKDDNDDREHLISTTKPLDQDFFVDVSDFTNWDKIADSYEFVLSDLPVDSNVDCTGPFYGSHRAVDCGEGSASKCWPKDWLAEDCPDVRLIAVNYETNISKWAHSCPVSPMSGKLEGRSRILMDTLASAGVGKRPIIWIGHSMGGLLVKRLLTLAKNSNDPAKNALLEQTKGIVFYSTPHKGSHLADLNTTSQMIVWPSEEVQELRQNSRGLLELHREFLDIVKEQPIKVVTFAERESTYVTSLKFELRFVDSFSATADVGEYYGIPLDHFSICKPSGRQSFLYQKVRRFIQDIIKEVEKERQMK